MKPQSKRFRRQPRGVAILAVLAVVVLLTAVVVYAITLSQTERRQAGKEIHNVNMQQMTEATLQTARNFFAARYKPLPPLSATPNWNTYLAYFVANPVVLNPASVVQANIAKLKTDHPELFTCVSSGPCSGASGGYDCFMYAQDNVDEFSPAPNNPSQDNDLFIYVGAVCAAQTLGGNTERAPLITELTAPLLYNPTSNVYTSQSSGGVQGLNNVSTGTRFR